MKTQITISDIPLQKIYDHAQAAFPNECCGFMFGTEKEERIVTIAKAVKNSKQGDQRRRFEISPLDYIKAEQFALDNDLQLLGIYHSHPNHPAIASIHDLNKALPYFSYVIVSVMDGELGSIKSWKLKENEHKFLEEKVSIGERLTVNGKR